MKTCNKCDMEGLEWDTTYHDNTDKWRLLEGSGKPHRCYPHKKGKFILAHHLKHCGLCESNNGWCTADEMDYHMQVCHPLLEYRTLESYRVV